MGEVAYIRRGDGNDICPDQVYELYYWDDGRWVLHDRKTADRVRQILDSLYTTSPDGLCGNEDVGAMSAWYILSAMGFYQVNPATSRYYIGSPIFDKTEINVSGGTFTIIAKSNSQQNKYIQHIKLNGQPYHKAWLDFTDIAAGGILEIEMGNQPAKWY